MHFGRVKIGDRYSVSPEATSGPTLRERLQEESEKKRAIKKRLASLEDEE
jgi:hypothetical protein